MSNPVNRFPAALEEAMVAILKLAECNIPTTVLRVGGELAAAVSIVTAKTEDPATCPRIVIHTGTGEEAVYQSGIYKLPLTVSVVTDQDSGSEAIANELIGRVTDVLQWPLLKDRLNARGTVFIHGLGPVTPQPNEEFGDRQWQESVALDVFGFAR